MTDTEHKDTVDETLKITKYAQEYIDMQCCKAKEETDIVLQVFNEYFTEELVDIKYHEKEVRKRLASEVYNISASSYDEFVALCGDINNSNRLRIYAYIYIKFPKVRVTNEIGEYTEITDLYVNVPVSMLGTMPRDFTMVRSSYTFQEWTSGYSHSHLPVLSSHEVPEFAYPCLGDSPLVNTVYHLKGNNDPDTWGLFCFELEKYVSIESLEGGPYIKIRSIGKGMDIDSILVYRDNIPVMISSISKYGNLYTIESFIKHFVTNYKTPVTFKNGQYSLSCSDMEFIIMLSDAFILWYNDIIKRNIPVQSLGKLIYYDILKSVIIDGNVMYNTNKITRFKIEDFNDSSLTDYDNTPFFFKGEQVKLHITGLVTPTSTNTTYILHPIICSYIATAILSTLNRYL